MAGYKETEDVLALVQFMSVEVGKAVTKDGFQYQDLLAFLQSDHFAERLEAALKDVYLVPVELSKLGWLGRIKLVQDVWRMVHEVLRAFGR